MSRWRRLSGLVGLAVGQLRTDRARTVLAILGVAVAVLTVTVLVGVGTGVFQTGEEYLDESGRDLWVTGGPVAVQPATVGGFQNPIPDAHALSLDLEDHPAVEETVPMAFQVVYVSADGEDFETLLGVGVPGGGPSLRLESGPGFSGSSHYANGSYDGPMSREVVVDPATAAALDRTVGDTLHVGGTTSNARRNAAEVVGISSTFRSFLGTRAVAMHLSELQTLTGTAYDDRATVITVSVAAGADRAAVARDLEAQFPGLTVRTNRELFASVIERQALVIAGGLSLAVLGVLAGTVLSLNLFLSLLAGQREDVAVLRAVGVSRGSVFLVAAVEALVVAVVGGGLGLVASPAIAAGLDGLAAGLVGFEGLVRIPAWGYLAGGGVAVVFGLVGAGVGVTRVSGADVASVLGR